MPRTRRNARPYSRNSGGAGGPPFRQTLLGRRLAAEDRDQPFGVDVAARDDADELSAGHTARERSGDRERPGALPSAPAPPTKEGVNAAPRGSPASTAAPTALAVSGWTAYRFCSGRSAA